MNRKLIVLILLLLGNGVANAADGCELPGSGIQWIADYCLLKLETDDLIVAQNCINSESKGSFKDECDQKIHYKRLMCKSAAAIGSYVKSEHTCISDPGFMGLVVRNNGL